MRTTTRILSLVGLVIACQEPYEFGELDDSELLVIDAQVSNQLDGTYVRIFNSSNSFFPQDPGILSIGIVENDEFIELELVNRQWIPKEDSFAGIVGGDYYLSIELISGGSIFSPVERIQEPFFLNSTAYIDEGITVDGNNEPSVVDFVYFEATIAPREIPAYAVLTYEYEYSTGTFVNRFSGDDFVLFDCLNRRCTNNNRVLVGSRERPIRRTADGVLIPTLLYTVKCKAVTAETYEFWSHVSTLINNDGFLQDNYPFTENGNIECDGCDFNLIGKFSAVSEEVSGGTI